MKALSVGKRGLSIIEIIIACALSSFSITLILLIISSQNNFELKSEENARIDNTLSELVESSLKNALSDFKNINSSVETENGIIKRIDVGEEDAFQKTITFSIGSETMKTLDKKLTLPLFNYAAAFGGNYCTAGNIDATHFKVVGSLSLSSGSVATDVHARGTTVFLSLDSASTTAADLLILDVSHPEEPVLLSSLNTGPGIASIAVAGNYVYAANTSSTNQLQVIDIHNLSLPKVVASIKIPFGTTKGVGSSIFYDHGFIYLGTTKGDGNELTIIDVTQPSQPLYVSGVEIGSKVNAITVEGNYAYIGSAFASQLVVFDVRDKSAIVKVNTLNPPGYETQEAESLYSAKDSLFYGRSVGGFNSPSNYELFSIQKGTSTEIKWQTDIGASVNGIIASSPLIFIGTNNSSKEFQIWDDHLSKLLYAVDMNATINALSCSGNTLYAALNNEEGMQMIIPYDDEK